jgi:AmiR/NasT family two-component response regulator
MDGIEAAREIKNRLVIPVLFLTASTDDEIIDRAKTTEPAGYISKPFKEEDLHSNIEMALHKHRAEKETEKEAEKDGEEATV